MHWNPMKSIGKPMESFRKLMKSIGKRISLENQPWQRPAFSKGGWLPVPPRKAMLFLGG